jgi:predicted RNA binding protein YcfA (HicA-like mRNA interferase family)
MGSKYPVLKSSEVVSKLKRHGFAFKSQKGSHAKYVKAEDNKPTLSAIVPMHYEVDKGTLQSILEQAGLTLDDFMSK